jgi:hypothetical protein
LDDLNCGRICQQEFIGHGLARARKRVNLAGGVGLVFMNRPLVALSLLAGIGLSMSGCGLARNMRFKKSSSGPVAPPVEPQSEYSPAPIVPSPFRAPSEGPTPAPTFDDPPPPSTSEYLAPPSQRMRQADRPALIAPQNARRLSPAGGHSTSAEPEQSNEPNFDDGPVARLKTTSQIEHFASFHGLR